MSEEVNIKPKDNPRATLLSKLEDCTVKRANIGLLRKHVVLLTRFFNVRAKSFNTAGFFAN